MEQPEKKAAFYSALEGIDLRPEDFYLFITDDQRWALKPLGKDLLRSDVLRATKLFEEHFPV